MNTDTLAAVVAEHADESSFAERQLHLPNDDNYIAPF